MNHWNPQRKTSNLDSKASACLIISPPLVCGAWPAPCGLWPGQKVKRPRCTIPTPRHTTTATQKRRMPVAGMAAIAAKISTWTGPKTVPTVSTLGAGDCWSKCLNSMREVSMLEAVPQLCILPTLGEAFKNGVAKCQRRGGLTKTP